MTCFLAINEKTICQNVILDAVISFLLYFLVHTPPRIYIKTTFSVQKYGSLSTFYDIVRFIPFNVVLLFLQIISMQTQIWPNERVNVLKTICASACDQTLSPMLSSDISNALVSLVSIITNLLYYTSCIMYMRWYIRYSLTTQNCLIYYCISGFKGINCFSCTITGGENFKFWIEAYIYKTDALNVC